MIFEQGDIVWVNFNPTFGHEPQNKRPALVVSGGSYNRLSNLTIVCPITTNDNGFPLHQEIASVKGVSGFIAIEQLRAVDLNVRADEEKIGRLTGRDLIAVLTCIESFFG
jgi:mRNA interferase MazF